MAEAKESDDTLSVSTGNNKFQEMRDNLNQKFSELTSLVNQKKLDLDRKIDDLELEYHNKNTQIEKDKQTLIKLKEHNTQELSQNSLLQLQENFNEDIADKIQELTTELAEQLTSELTLDFDLDALIEEIDGIDVQLSLPDKPEILAASESKSEMSLASEESDESSSDDYSTPSPKPKSKNRITSSYTVDKRGYFSSLPKKKNVLQSFYPPEIPTSKKAKYDPCAKKSQARLK